MLGMMITKTCSKCKSEKMLKEFYKNSTSKDGLTAQCRLCIKAKYKRVEKLEKILWSEKQVRVCKTCGLEKPLIDFRRSVGSILDRSAHCKRCSSTAHVKKYRKQKEKILQRYGDRCACCGESIKAFLTIDHINGNGGQEKKAKGASTMMRELASGPMRDDIQILCYNCNCSKYHNGGICPHKEILMK